MRQNKSVFKRPDTYRIQEIIHIHVYVHASMAKKYLGLYLQFISYKFIH